MMAVVARVEPKNVVKNVASSIRVSPCWVQRAELGAPHILAAKMQVCQHGVRGTSGSLIAVPQYSLKG